MSDDALPWGGEAREPTDAEVKFGSALLGLLPGVQLWLHSDPDPDPEGVGDPAAGRSAWLCVSRDFVVDRTVCDTLRLDFDREGIRGGWSPACLGWDKGVRAEAAGIDVRGADGVVQAIGDKTPQHLAMIAAKWFAVHVDLWPGSPRGRRWATK